MGKNCYYYKYFYQYYKFLVFRKFGQNPNKDQHKIVVAKQVYDDIAHNPDYKMKHVARLESDASTLLLVYENADGSSAVPNYRTNIVIAAFVTMYARITLYNLLKKVDSQKGVELLYFDTVIFYIFNFNTSIYFNFY